MNLPEAENAIVDLQKLRDYCLNPMHPRGRHKARVFASALQIQQSDAQWLKATLLEAAQQNPVIAGEVDDYGSRYILDFKCTKGTSRATIRSGWIIRRGESVPRLTTCYVLSE